MRCPYCLSEAALRIPSVPDRVCLNHAIEFWTGLLRYNKVQSRDERRELPCELGHLDGGFVPQSCTTTVSSEGLMVSPSAS
jgi:hypothetical protein